MTAPIFPDQDRRRHSRATSIKKVRLETGGDDPVFMARVLDMSVAGARLQLEAPAMLPETFLLTVHTADAPSSKQVRCRLQWQQNTQLGVSFY